MRRSTVWHLTSMAEAGVAGLFALSGDNVSVAMAIALGLFSILSAVTSAGCMIKESLKTS